jgi:hypothetical protein
MIDFGSNNEMQKVSSEAREFFEKVLYDEEPLFVSDKATILDVSSAAPADLLERCAKFYGKSLSMNDLKQPLWKLIRLLNEGRDDNRP